MLSKSIRESAHVPKTGVKIKEKMPTKGLSRSEHGVTGLVLAIASTLGRWDRVRVLGCGPGTQRRDAVQGWR